MVRYRPNVAALILNTNGSLLICERSNMPGAWQFPQGGVDNGESIEQALIREVREEVGLGKNDYEILESREGYRYLYPPEVRVKKSARTAVTARSKRIFSANSSPPPRPSMCTKLRRNSEHTGGSRPMSSISIGFPPSSARSIAQSWKISLESASKQQLIPKSYGIGSWYPVRLRH